MWANSWQHRTHHSPQLEPIFGQSTGCGARCSYAARETRTADESVGHHRDDGAAHGRGLQLKRRLDSSGLQWTHV